MIVTRAAARLACACAVAALAAGCSLVLHVDESRTVEATEALCDDGVDNDADGLTDCQDWKCLGLRPCCTMPAVRLADAFEQAACATPACDAGGGGGGCPVDGALWKAWGEPQPVVCDGGLAVRKREQCYDVGVLAREPVPLRPGLAVAAEVSGRPEIAGRLEVGLALQADVTGGLTPCTVTEPVALILSVRTARTADGYVATALVDGREIGASAVVADVGRHRLALAVGHDRRARFQLDGREFAATPAGQPIGDLDPGVHVVLRGRSVGSRFESVQVSDGTRCEDPRAWTKAPGFVALDAAAGTRWESYLVERPSAARDPELDRVRLYYRGCERDVARDACPVDAAFGLALSTARGPFMRAGAEPVLPGRDGWELAALKSDALPSLAYVVRSAGVTGWRVGVDGRLQPFGDVALDPAPRPGDWDDGEPRGASAVLRDGRVYLFYARTRKRDGVPRIGLATSDDGLHFARRGDPVLAEGPPGARDAGGVADPDVVWDERRGLFRMWYVTREPPGLARIDHAVSTDGVTWHRYPGNPVIEAERMGLRALGRPTVVLEPDRARLFIDATEFGRTTPRIYAFENAGRN